MGASDNELSIARVAASVQTVGQGRAVLGAATGLLRQAYEKLDSITSVEGVRDQARNNLDIVNAYAGGIYALLPSDDARQGDALTTKQAQQIGLSLRQSQDALKDIEEAAGFDFWDVKEVLSNAVASVAGNVGAGAQAVTNALAAGGSALFSSAWPLALGATILVGGYLLWRFRGAFA
jgi:hypothetical protein